MEESNLTPALGQERRASFLVWFRKFVRNRKTINGALYVAAAAIAWFGEQWFFGPAAFIIVWITVNKILTDKMPRTGRRIIETRLQGQKITWCDYYEQKEFIVPNTVVREHWVPDSKRERTYVYGDDTPLAGSGIYFADYVDVRENGDVVMIFPENVDVGNYVLPTGINHDIVRVMGQLGPERLNIQKGMDRAGQLYLEGKISREEFRGLAFTAAAKESVIAREPAARRDVLQHMQDKYPRLLQNFIELRFKVGTIATAMAAKFLQRTTNSPMTEEISQKIEGVMNEHGMMDFETEMDKLNRAREEAKEPRPRAQLEQSMEA